jgi:ribosomal protein S18 acetylase RimI-like enzyme
MGGPRAWSIRALRADESTAAVTALLHRAYARLAAMGLNYTAVDQDDATTARRARKGTCLLAESGKALVGTLAFHGPDDESQTDWFTRPHVVVMEQFAVDPALQGRGIGGALLSEAESRAVALGATHLVLDTAEPAVHLVRFYERLGFRVVDHVRWPAKVYRSVILARPLP